MNIFQNLNINFNLNFILAPIGAVLANQAFPGAGAGQAVVAKAGAFLSPWIAAQVLALAHPVGLAKGTARTVWAVGTAVWGTITPSRPEPKPEPITDVTQVVETVLVGRGFGSHRLGSSLRGSTAYSPSQPNSMGVPLLLVDPQSGELVVHSSWGQDESGHWFPTLVRNAEPAETVKTAAQAMGARLNVAGGLVEEITTPQELRDSIVQAVNDALEERAREMAAAQAADIPVPMPWYHQVLLRVGVGVAVVVFQRIVVDKLFSGSLPGKAPDFTSGLPPAPAGVGTGAEGGVFAMPPEKGSPPSGLGPFSLDPQWFILPLVPTTAQLLGGGLVITICAVGCLILLLKSDEGSDQPTAVPLIGAAAPEEGPQPPYPDREPDGESRLSRLYRRVNALEKEQKRFLAKNKNEPGFN